MNKNIVKSGLIDQRNRSSKHRGGKNICFKKQPEEALSNWHDEHPIEDSDIGKINLTSYIISTEHIDISPGERLRQLAIKVESDARVLPGKSGWLAIKRIYQYALKLDETNEYIWHSMGISAQQMADTTEDKNFKASLHKENLSAILHALSIRPEWSCAHYSLGFMYYLQGKNREALEEFKTTLTCDNQYNIHSWAHLYSAHCYHDIGKWKQALNAYRLVDRSALNGHVAWRQEVLCEQIAECTYKLGDKTKAKLMVSKILTRYEAEPALAISALSSSFWIVAKSISNEFVERAKKLAE